jgi:pilus assembly protein CpaF
MLQAMGTGHHGSMATIHANNTRDALDRLEMLIGLGNMRAEPRTLRRYIASIIHVLVHVRRAANGRVVQTISEVTGVEGDAYTMSELFRFVEDAPASGRGKFEQVVSRSHFASQLRMVDLKDI